MWLYRLLLLLALPFIGRRLWRFHKRYDNYRLKEALGSWPQTQADLWLHCASVGEVLAARPLVNQWLEGHPDKQLLITTVTPTGAEQVQKWFADRVQHRYLPVDYAGCVKRALRRLSCSSLAIIETELWPNLLTQAKAKGLTIQVINARLSERSAKRYQTFRFFSKTLMALPDRFLAHANADAERFKALGARDVQVTGSIKFDITAPEDFNVEVWREQLAPAQQFVWIAASTHAGEDAQFIEAHQALLQRVPNAKLILVPRHPERFDEVHDLVKHSGLTIARRSDDRMAEWADANVLLGDSMGEMMRYLAVSDVAFVGGSMIKRGGHNPIEPAVLAKPVLVGEHTFNFADITKSLIQEGGAVRVYSVAELVEQLILLQDTDLRHTIGQKALTNAQSNQGALARTLGYLENA